MRRIVTALVLCVATTSLGAYMAHAEDQQQLYCHEVVEGPNGIVLCTLGALKYPVLGAVPIGETSRGVPIITGNPQCGYHEIEVQGDELIGKLGATEIVLNPDGSTPDVCAFENDYS